jgi:hypothetical protein
MHSNKIKTINHRDQIKEFLKLLDSPIICEVGVRLGDNFRNILVDNIKTAYAVDIWKETSIIGQNDGKCKQTELNMQYENFKNEYKDDNRVVIIRDFSEKAALEFPNNYFDFVYLDADHTYEAVKKDLESWYPKIKIGGVLSGHDYIDGNETIRLGHYVKFGVVEAVSEFLKNNNIKNENFHLTSEQYASYFIIKE